MLHAPVRHSGGCPPHPNTCAEQKPIVHPPWRPWSCVGRRPGARPRRRATARRGRRRRAAAARRPPPRSWCLQGWRGVEAQRQALRRGVNKVRCLPAAAAHGGLPMQAPRQAWRGQRMQRGPHRRRRLWLRPLLPPPLQLPPPRQQRTRGVGGSRRQRPQRTGWRPAPPAAPPPLRTRRLLGVGGQAMGALRPSNG